MHADRLLKLATLLEADAANDKGIKFDLGWWAAPSDEANTGLGRTDVFPSNVEPIPVSCNTSACAMGLAVISNAFQEHGLYAHYYEGKDWDGKQERPVYTMYPGIEDAGGCSKYGFDAAVVLFDIENDDAMYLFDPQYYDETKGAQAELVVAKRIRDFVGGRIDQDYYPQQDEPDCDDAA